MVHRIFILGASGSGTSTLGRALASALNSQAFDTDDFYWVPSDPPFQTARKPADRTRLMTEMMLPRRDWVLSGSACGWGDAMIPRLTLVLFLLTDRDTRLERLKTRETARNGALIAPGGPLAAQHRGFLDWAGGYEDFEFTGRSRHQHEDWLTRVSCPVLRLDGGLPVQDNIDQVFAAIDQRSAAE